MTTATYAAPTAEERGVLRESRDEALLTDPLGKILSKLCDKVSQPIALL
jgi:hypothetical protein